MKYRRLKPTEKVQVGDYLTGRNSKFANDSEPRNLCNNTVNGWCHITDSASCSVGETLESHSWAGLRKIE